MQVDIIFPFAKVFDIHRIDVVLGQKFTLIARNPGKLNWFANHDPVLTVTDSGSSAEVTASALGISTILILDEDFALLKKMTIRVVDEILDTLTDLGLTADPPVNKP